MMNIGGIKEKWKKDGIELPTPAINSELDKFRQETGLEIPEDLIQYFLLLNGTSDEYDNSLFKFYSLTEFLSVKCAVGDWGGAPNYTNIVNTLDRHEHCFVFSDRCFHECVYAIRLAKNALNKNDVYIIQGSRYRKISGSFTEFMNLYINDDDTLYSL